MRFFRSARVIQRFRRGWRAPAIAGAGWLGASALLAADGDALLVSTPDFDLIASYDDLIVLGSGAQGEPIELGRLSGVADAAALAVDRDLALVALPAHLVLVVGLESPSEPEALAVFVAGGDAGPLVSVAIQGDRGYALSEGGRLDILGLDEPTEPVLLGSWETEGDSYGYGGGFVAAGEGGAAYLALREPGRFNHLHVIDASEPNHPERVARLKLGAQWLSESATSGIARAGTTLMTPYGEDWWLAPPGFAAWDVQDPLVPELRWSWRTQYDTSPAAAIGVTSADSMAAFLWQDLDSGAFGLSRAWLSDGTPADARSTAAGGIAVSGAPGRLAVLVDRSPAWLVRYGQEVPERWESGLDGTGSGGLIAHFDSRILYAKNHYADSAWTIVDASDPRSPEIVGTFGLKDRDLELPVIAGDRAAAMGGGGYVCFFDLSESVEPQFVSEILMEEVKDIALGRKTVRSPSRNRSLAGRDSSSDRYYLHTHGKRYDDWSWITHFVFQSVDISDLSEPRYLGKWLHSHGNPYGYYPELLEAIGDVAVFVAKDWDETTFATWTAGSESLRPVEWFRTGECVQAMATQGRSLVLGNYYSAFHYCKGWLSAWDVSPEGVLTDLPAGWCTYWNQNRGVYSDPEGTFYNTQDSGYEERYQLEAVALDSDGEFVPTHYPTGLLHDECGSVVAPIRGALVAACSYDNTLRIQPTEYALSPFPLGEWVEASGTEEALDEY